jgi:hypothetical protein
LSGVRLTEQRLRLLEVQRVEAFRKPAVNRSKQFTSLLRLPLITPEPRRAHRQEYFPGKATGAACSDWHGRRIVSEQAEVISTSPRAEMLKIGALQRVRAFSGLDLHGISTVLARPFVTQQCVL